ncbi:toll-like receptor 6 [Mytilus galloprovincialis]|uniref:toll-like receptor 6 n=1 Tax=Mytilus galloprovincialis TaxID=29158 RepID=UPI003F7CB60F
MIITDIWFGILAIFMIMTIIHTDTDLECGKFCKCLSRRFKRAICHGSYIPTLPVSVSEVELRNSNRTDIGRFALVNLTSHRVTEFVLSGNSICHINQEAFVNLTWLSVLTVNNETSLSVDRLKKALTKLSLNYTRKLRFTNNNWTYLPNDMFEPFINTKIKAVFLTGNQFSYINGSSFKFLTLLEKLVLENNKLIQIHFWEMPRLKNLRLNGNRLAKVPNFCNFENSLFPRLESLSLSDNNIGNIDKTSFLCLPALKFLKMMGISIVELKNNIFSGLTKLKDVSLGKISTLKRIEDFAFNNTSLKRIFMNNCKFRFDRIERFNPVTIFKFCPNVNYVNLGLNHMPKIPNILHVMFKPLDNLESLLLHSTGILDLPRNLLSNFRKLRDLNLQDNKLHFTFDHSIGIFGNITSLKSLDLSSNLISIINKTLLSSRLLNSLEQINFGFNPFSCTCDQKWLLEWIKQTKVKIVGYPKNYKCRYPNELAGQYLNSYTPTDDICKPWNQLYTIAIVLPLFGVSTLVIIIFIWICQNNIKNSVYLLRVVYNHIQGHVVFNESLNYEFHAFVVYCDADREWVHNVFLKRIESEEGIKLCIHQRDFDIGKNITGNIDKYIEKSWKVVVVMSNDFAKSEWCQWEVDVVQERRRRQGKDAFLLIMLKTIDSKHMTSPLRTLLESTPHVRYQTGVGEDLFWRAAAKSLQKPLGLPPVAVL